MLTQSVKRWCLATALPGLLLLAGCSGYHAGSLMHPQIKTLAVGEFRNDTEEAFLTAALRQKLADAFTVDGSVRVVAPEAADVVVRGTIKQIGVQSIASHRLAENVRDGNRDNYQTQIYRVSVEVAWELVLPNRRRPVLDSRPAKGAAEFSSLPDFHVARNEALRRALADAAEQIRNGVVEGW